MTISWTDRYERQIEILARRVVAGASSIALEDVFMLLAEVVEEIGSRISMAGIERRVAALEQFDLESIAKGIAVFKTRPLNRFTLTVSPKRTIEASAVVTALENHLSKMKEQAASSSRINTVFYLGLVMDTEFGELLECFQGDEPEIRELEGLAEGKVALLGDLDLARLWANTQNDLRALQEKANELSLPGAGWEDFGKPRSTEETAHLIANYAVVRRPQLLKALTIGGATEYPIATFGVARLLSMNTESVAQVTYGERNLIIETARLVYCWGEVFKRDKSEVLDLLQLPAEGVVAGGALVGDFRKVFTTEIRSHASRLDFCLSTLSRILLLFSGYLLRHSPMESALVEYKLGLELFVRENRNVIRRGRGELELQKDVCKYLLDRSIYSYGTRFGNSEVDLLVSQDAEAVVLEAKIYRRNPQPAMITAHVAQLVSYMDQQKPLPIPRGVLLIYNLADVPIDAPKKWLRDRYWILVVNLCAASPSRRGAAVLVEEAPGGDVVRVLRVGGEKRPRQKRQGGTKVRRRTKKTRQRR